MGYKSKSEMSQFWVYYPSQSVEARIWARQLHKTPPELNLKALQWYRHFKQKEKSQISFVFKQVTVCIKSTLLINLLKNDCKMIKFQEQVQNYYQN